MNYFLKFSLIWISNLVQFMNVNVKTVLHPMTDIF